MRNTLESPRLLEVNGVNISLALVWRTGLIYEVKTNFALGSDSGVQMRRHHCL